MSNTVLVPLSWGELADKISILEIKMQLLSDRPLEEWQLLERYTEKLNSPLLVHHYQQLKTINQRLWWLEEILRRIDDTNHKTKMPQVAHLIHRNNKRRHLIKSAISQKMGCFKEHKNYQSMSL